MYKDLYNSRKVERRLERAALAERHTGEECVVSRGWHGSVLTYEMFCQAVIKRDVLVRNVHGPAMLSLPGQCVRVRLDNGYAIRKVRAVHKGNEYAIKCDGKVHMTNKKVCINCEDSTDMLPLTYISNVSPSHAEYLCFKKRHGEPFVQRMCKKAKQFTCLLDAGRQSMDRCAQTNKIKKTTRQQRHTNLMEKIKLIRERDNARKMGETERYISIQRRINKIDETDRDMEEEKERVV